MVVLGVIVLIVVAVVAVVIVLQGGDPVSLDLPGFDVDTTAAGVFGIGAACAVLALLGLALMVGGARRGNRRRKEVKQLRREADSQPTASRSGTDTGGSPVQSDRKPSSSRAEDGPSDHQSGSEPRS